MMTAEWFIEGRNGSLEEKKIFYVIRNNIF